MNNGHIKYFKINKTGIRPWNLNFWKKETQEDDF